MRQAKDISKDWYSWVDAIQDGVDKVITAHQCRLPSTAYKRFRMRGHTDQSHSIC